ncbi:hypothetical protein GCM10027184_39840 [Saccharothrix stipae]
MRGGPVAGRDHLDRQVDQERGGAADHVRADTPRGEFGQVGQVGEFAENDPGGLQRVGSG